MEDKELEREWHYWYVRNGFPQAYTIEDVTKMLEQAFKEGWEARGKVTK